MICSNCGQRIADESFFCPHCGQTTKESTSIQKCPSCASVVKGTDTFCNICGYRLKGQPPADLAAATQAPALQNRPTLCRVCGKPLNLNSEFCSSCGAPVKTEQPLQAYPQPSQNAPLPNACPNILKTGWNVLKNAVKAFITGKVNEGRLSLYEYLSFCLIGFLIQVPFVFLGALLAGALHPDFFITIPFLSGSALFWFAGLNISVRRLHDVGLSGFCLLIPIYGFFVLFAPGTKGPNKYGPDPRDNLK